MKKVLSSAQGRITDFKVLETEKGKMLAHLQIQDDEQRVSNVLVPASVLKKWKPMITKAFEVGEEIEVRGSMNDLGTQVLLMAERVSLPGTE